MATQRWKVTMILDVEESSHPRKFVPDDVSMGLHPDEDLVDYRFEEVEEGFVLPKEPLVDLS